ncbi:MAG: hypothetical protein AAB529_01020 [Patescibacteria group bacterium]
MKYLSLVSLIIAVVVVVNEFSYIGESSLAWVLIGLAVSVILLAIDQLGWIKA